MRGTIRVLAWVSRIGACMWLVGWASFASLSEQWDAGTPENLFRSLAWLLAPAIGLAVAAEVLEWVAGTPSLARSRRRRWD